MKPSQIESWALRVLEKIKSRSPVEDSLVEMKANWIDAKKAARRIAAHANAAQGEPILWLVGADETAGIVGANYQELSSWFPQVKSVFEGVAPALHHLNVSFEGKIIAALCFDTSRFPFVVKNPEFGSVKGMPEYEVPWREGTRTRSAKRNDLVLLLNPLVKPPKVEILDGEIRFEIMATDPINHQLRFTLKIYVVPLSDAPLTFPFHKCAACLSSNGKVISDKFALIMDTTKGKNEKAYERMQVVLRRASATEPDPHHVNVVAAKEVVEVTSDEAIFRGPGKIEIDGYYGVLAFDSLPELELAVTLVEAVTEANVPLSCKFLKRETGLVWTLNK